MSSVLEKQIVRRTNRLDRVLDLDSPPDMCHADDLI